MRSLFWKIFLFFWLAMLIIGVAFAWLYVANRPQIKFERKNFMVRHAFYVHGKRIVRLLQTGQEKVAWKANQELHNKFRVRAYVFQGNLVLASPWKPTEEVRRIAKEAFIKNKFVRYSTSNKTMLFAVPLSISKNNSHFIVGVLPNRSRLEKYIQPNTLFWRFLILILVTGFICYLLAGFLTRPILLLRTTVQRLARGDLEARVDPEVRMLRDEVGELAHDFDLMAGRIKQLLDTQTRLVRDISHELRSPLARLYVALELARQKSEPSTSSSIDRIELEADRLKQLIGQILTLSQLESGNQFIKKDALDLKDLLQKIIQDANYEAQASNCSVVLKDSDGLLVQGDTELLRRAIENVIRNAIRYTPEGTTVDIRLYREQVEQRSMACVEVSDCGPGVPEDSLDQLFQPFYQVDEARSPQHDGKGLGLAITKRSVHLHEGFLQATNNSDVGLTVKLYLPLFSADRSNQ